MVKISVGISTLVNNKKKAVELAAKIRESDCNNFIDAIMVLSQGELEEKSYLLGGNVKLYETTERGLSKSRNALLDISPTDYVWLIDDDVVITESALDNVYNLFKEKAGHDLFIGRVYCTDKDEYFKKYKKERHGYTGVLSVSSIEMIISKKFLAINSLAYNTELGLGAKYPCGEENELLIKCLNHGASIYFSDKVFIFHPSISSLNKGDYFSTKEQIIAKKIVAKELPFRFRILYSIKIILYLALYKKDLALLSHYLKPSNKAVL